MLELYLFDVEEVLGIKGDGSAGHRNILIQSTTVADIGPHSECHCFSLYDSSEKRVITAIRWQHEYVIGMGYNPLSQNMKFHITMLI